MVTQLWNDIKLNRTNIKNNNVLEGCKIEAAVLVNQRLLPCRLSTVLIRRVWHIKMDLTAPRFPGKERVDEITTNLRHKIMKG